MLARERVKGSVLAVGPPQIVGTVHDKEVAILFWLSKRAFDRVGLHLSPERCNEEALRIKGRLETGSAGRKLYRGIKLTYCNSQGRI